MTLEYQIDNEFTSDPTKKGWGQFDGASFAWDTVDKVGGFLGIDADARYIKYLPKDLNQDDPLIARFVIEVEAVIANTGGVFFGFYNSSESGLTKHVFGLRIINSSGTPTPRIELAYSDGTQIIGSGFYSLSQSTKYIGVIRYVPDDRKAYVEIYDFLTETLLFQDFIELDTSKDFIMQQVGMSETAVTFVQTAKGWMYDVKAVAEPESVVYSSLYCTPEEARKMTNLDAVQDMTDDMLAQIEKVYAMPQVDSRFRSEGYAAPFSFGVDTPPLIKTVTALLTAAYAAKKAYTGHAQNESPNYQALLDEVNMIWDAFLAGKMELIDTSGAWIERTLDTSTDMLSTTECDTSIFTLDAIGGIGE